MPRLLKIFDERIEIYLSSIFLIIFSVLTIIQVAMRYIVNNSLTWSEELSRYAFIWFVYASASYAVKCKSHVKFGFFVNFLPQPLKKSIEIIALLLWLGFLVFLDFFSYEMTLHLYESMQTSPANKFPMYLIYLAVPVGALLMTIRVSQHIIDSIKKFHSSN